MKNNNIFWGVGFVILGLFLLGLNFDWFDFDLSSVAKYWPFFLILAGINLIIARKTGATPTGLTAIFVILAIPLAISHGVERQVNGFEDKIENAFDFDDDDDFNSNGEFEGGAKRDYDESDSSSNASSSISGDAQIYESGVYNNQKEANLNIVAGAANLDVVEESKAIFKGVAKMSDSDLKFKFKTEDEGGTANIDFKMDGKINGKDNDIQIDGKNLISLGLNKNPIWNLDVVFGAGKSDLDLTNYKTKTIDIKAGAGDLDLKLGDKLEKQTVKIKSGASSVTIKVPKSVGCEIEIDGILNSKDIDGFEKNDGKYQTSNLGSATKKIKIEIESAVASINVERY
jgi:hypothetical protein